MTDATLTAAEGVGTTAWTPSTLGVPRSLYLAVNKGVQDLTVTTRSLYEYVNNGIQALTVLDRALYLYVNNGIWALSAEARSLYLYEATRDTEVFPWLAYITPTEQYRGGQVELAGDGLGSLIEVGAAATLTASSTNGVNIPAWAVDRTQAQAWISNDTTGAWLRFTFATPQPVVAIALVGRISGSTWGTPLFRFSDGGPDVVGGSAVPTPAAAGTTEYPVGLFRTYYALPTTRTVDWVEVRVSSGGSGSNRGLSEAWVYADQDVSAEASETILGVEILGIVLWQNRSDGLYPANGGQPILPCATVTLSDESISGMLFVRESI